MEGDDMKDAVTMKARTETDVKVNTGAVSFAAAADSNDIILDGMNRKAMSVRRIACLLVGLVTLFFMGLIFAWSIFATPIANSTGWDPQLLAFNFRIVMICQAVGCLASSMIQRQCNGRPRVPIFIGGALVLIGFISVGALSSLGIVSVFVFYGGFAAFGAGIAFNAILTTVNLWFPDRVGVVSGLQMFAFGVASLVLGVQIDGLMNTIGWQTVLAGLGILIFALNVVASFVIKASPAGIDEVFRGKAASAKAESGDGRNAAAKNPHFLTDFGVSKKSFGIPDMLKTPVFWLGLAWFVCVASIGLTLMGESRQDALALGTEATLATLIVGMISLFNGGASIVYGFLLDRFGLINHLRLTTGISVAGICLITAACFAQSSPLFIFGALVLAVGYGGLPVFSTTFTLNRYGRTHYAENCAVGTAFLVPASLASMILAPIFSGFGGLAFMYAGFVGVILVGIILLLAFSRRYRRDMVDLV